jgi:hypothetical protein
MKPFTFMTVVLGLILGFLFASSRATLVPRPERRAFVREHQRPVALVRDDRDDRDDREEAEGLPVPIVPGTRVTEAQIQPPKRVNDKGLPTRRARAKGLPPGTGPVAYQHSSTIRSIAGRLSADVDRARDDARLQLEREVTEWLTPEVPTHWRPPAHLVTRMIRKTDIRPMVRDYGTVYEANLEADFSPNVRDAIRAAYRHELVARRLAILAGALGFVLVCLASVAGYIRADEATRGYYTHWLRAVAAAGVGASGVLIYQILA